MKLRILFVVDEAYFFLPEFVSGFLARTSDLVVGAALVTSIKPKNDARAWLARHFYYLTASELARLAWRCAALAARERAGGRGEPPPSVAAALRRAGIPFFEVEREINQEPCLRRIREAWPDLIVSSCSAIFAEELLSLPRICCLNRHSSLLPAYGGLWPVLQAYRSGESHTGASIHVMQRTIDAGPVLARRRVPIAPGESLFDLYRRCFQESVNALLEAVDRARSGDLSPLPVQTRPSYFSFPSRDHWAAFRERGGRFI